MISYHSLEDGVSARFSRSMREHAPAPRCRYAHAGEPRSQGEDAQAHSSKREEIENNPRARKARNFVSRKKYDKAPPTKRSLHDEKGPVYSRHKPGPQGRTISTVAPRPLSRGSQTEFEVIPGRRGASSDVATLPSSIIGAAKAVVVVALVIAMVCCVRVGLSAASATTIEATGLAPKSRMPVPTEATSSRFSRAASQIDAYSRGGGKSWSHASEKTVAVVLGADVVATDEAGNLSLFGSIAALENQG